MTANPIQLPLHLQAMCHYFPTNTPIDNCPLLQAATSKKELTDEHHIYGFKMPFGITAHAWLEQLAALHNNRLELDCSLFAQLCLVNAEDTAFIIHIPLSNIIMLTMPSLRYICPANEEMKELLDSLLTCNRGMWVVETGPDSFFGLSPEDRSENGGGGVSHSFAEWSELLTTGLQRDIISGCGHLGFHSSLSEVINTTKYNMAKYMIALGQLQWTFMKSFMEMMSGGYSDTFTSVSPDQAQTVTGDIVFSGFSAADLSKRLSPVTYSAADEVFVIRPKNLESKWLEVVKTFLNRNKTQDKSQNKTQDKSQDKTQDKTQPLTLATVSPLLQAQHAKHRQHKPDFQQTCRGKSGQGR